MTTVLAGLTWATESKKLLQHVRHRAGDEAILHELFDVAVEVCHEEIGRRDFTTPAIATTEWIANMGLTSADPTEVMASASVPATVRYGVYEYVRVAYADRHRLPGVQSETNGAGGESRTPWAADNFGSLPLVVAQSHWRRYLLDATLAGALPG